MEAETRHHSSEWDSKIGVYFLKLSHGQYQEMVPSDQDFILGIHEHLKGCNICRENYDYIKRSFETDDHDGNEFPSEKFRLIKQNEDYMNSLLD